MDGSMTIKQARKILGKKYEKLSDDVLKKDIEIAEILKNLFFEMVTNSLNKKTSKEFLNVP